MTYNKNIIITESEKNRILNLYGRTKINESYSNLNKKQDFVFDFVLTENKKYVIIMDEVFATYSKGKSIGSIWENTHIFNELINESLNKLGNNITESVRHEVDNILENVKWTKENISKWITDSPILSEQSVWDTIKASGSKIVDSLGKGMEGIFKEGVLPFLRWVRRGLQTGVGMVIDIVASILLVKSNMVVWLLVCALDIYEIVTNDYDPKDPERKESPYMGLISDMISALFTAAAGKLFSKAVPQIQKAGIQKASPTIIRMLETLSNKIPTLNGQIKNATTLLAKKFKGDGVISTILRSIDNVLLNLENFVSKLLSKQGAKAVATGVGLTAATKNTIAPDMGWTKNNYKKDVANDIETNKINPEIIAMAKELGHLA
jgi:hypothetical protein